MLLNLRDLSLFVGWNIYFLYSRTILLGVFQRFGRQICSSIPYICAKSVRHRDVRSAIKTAKSGPWYSFVKAQEIFYSF